MTQPSTIERLEQVSAAVVYDVMAYMGLRNQCLSAELAPLDPTVKIVGRAVTVKGTATARWDETVNSAMSYELFHLIEPGTIVVIATQGNEISGPWGANTGLDALTRGARGVVIDGGTRDRSALIAMGLPVYCRFVTPVLAHGHWQVTDVGVPVEVAGQSTPRVLVHPGDAIVGDGDGVVVVPQDIEGHVTAAAVHAESIEGEIERRLRARESRESIDRECDRWRYLRDQGLFVGVDPRLSVPVNSAKDPS